MLSCPALSSNKRTWLLVVQPCRSELSQRTDIVKCPRNVDYILAQQKALMQQPGWRPGRNVGELGEEKLRVSDAPRGMYAS